MSVNIISCSKKDFQANLLAWHGKLNLAQQKHTFTNQKKYTTTQSIHKKNWSQV